MSDLISRKKISGYIKMVINPYGKPFKGTAYELGLKIIKYIDAMNSAYDVDKVVEELLALNQNYNDGINLYEEVAEIPTEEVIEIVKQGGISDLCEKVE